MISQTARTGRASSISQCTTSRDKMTCYSTPYGFIRTPSYRFGEPKKVNVHVMSILVIIVHCWQQYVDYMFILELFVVTSSGNLSSIGAFGLRCVERYFALRTPNFKCNKDCHGCYGLSLIKRPLERGRGRPCEEGSTMFYSRFPSILFGVDVQENISSAA
jgi:hypothetical protein